MGDTGHILVVDADPEAAELVRLVARGRWPNAAVTHAADAVAFAEALSAAAWTVALVEADLPWSQGIAVVGALLRRCPHRPCVVFARAPTARSAVEALRAGAMDCIEKSVQGVLVLAAALDPILGAPPTHAAPEEPAERALRHALTAAANGQSAAEQQAWEQLLLFEPHHPQGLERLAALYGAAQRWQDVARLQRRWVELAQNPADLRNRYKSLVETLVEKLADPEAALVAWTAWRRRDPNNNELTRTLRDALVRLKRWPAYAELLREQAAEAATDAQRLIHLEELARVPGEHLGSQAEEAGRATPQAAEPEPPADPRATIAHDLQEPLRSVASYLQVLQSRHGETLPADAAALIDKARLAAVRMQDKVASHLDQTTSRVTEAKSCDCEAVIQATLTDLSAAIEQAAAQIEVGSLPQLQCDAGALGIVFQNLVSNALKYRGTDAPHVTIGAQQTRSGWEFQVSDNGIGIGAEDHVRIFRMFERGSQTTGQPGSGIGLGLCASIVRRMGGSIWVESEPGRGATFRFTVPADAVRHIS